MKQEHPFPADLRRAIRAGDFCVPTAGRCPGFVQTNLVILPQAYAEEFAEFCRLNPRPCPLVARTEPGRFDFAGQQPCAAVDGDLRTDIARYRIFRDGRAESAEPTEIRDLWRDDFCGFLLGCSFTFEAGLVAAGLPVRHLDEGCNVPMFRTSIPCSPAGRFRGDLVVSMRPYRPEQVEAVIAVTARYPQMHGAPIHVGDPAAIGVADATRPDFGDPVTIRDGEVPVFWACGVTPQLALVAAAPKIAITHSPGFMFVTDLPEAAYRQDFCVG